MLVLSCNNDIKEIKNILRDKCSVKKDESCSFFIKLEAADLFYKIINSERNFVYYRLRSW